MAILQLGAGGDLALDVAGKGFPSQRRTAVLRAEVEGGCAVGLLVGVGIQAQGDEQVGLETVGKVSALLGGGVVPAGPGNNRLHASGNHAALDALRQVPEDLLFGDLAVGPVHYQAAVAAAEVRVDHYALAGEVRARLPHGFALADCLRGPACDAAAQQRKGVQGVGPACAVVVEAGVELVVHQRLVGVRPETAVHPVRVEPQLVQLGLQLGNIVADHLLARLVAQHAGAEGVGRLAQFPQGRVIDRASGHDPARLLEGFDGFAQDVVEKHLALGEAAGVVDVAFVTVEEPQACKGHPDLGNSGAGVANVQYLSHAGLSGSDGQKQYTRC